MAELNPDPYKDGDPFGPTGRITAIFDVMANLKSAYPLIEAAGFNGSNFAIFVGTEGEIQFDATGIIRGMTGLKAFQNAVCDEGDLYDQFDAALQKGGAVVAIRTGDDEVKKTCVTEILKANNARHINYWGTWHYDRLGK